MEILSRSQIVWEDYDSQGLMGAEVAFLARKVPAVGYDTYHVDFVSGAPAASTGGVMLDRSTLTLENEHLRVARPGVRGRQQPDRQVHGP